MKNDFDLKNKIEIASGRKECDLVIKNARIVNVFSHEVIEGNLAVSDGYIIGIGDYIGKETIDANKKYIIPGLIDSHVHIESSFATPFEFARAVLPRGTTTVIADCHEIANVCGLDGIKYMLESSKDLPLDVYMMLPSCVPTSDFDTSGARLEAEDLEELMGHERVLGLGEVMNYPGVINGDSGILKKLELTKKYNKIADGHGPLIKGKELNTYTLAGVKTDHECTNYKEFIERLRKGVYIAIREGSAAKNIIGLAEYINPYNERQCTFCTDDRHPEDIIKDGHIDNNIRVAIGCGIDPISAIRMATINTAKCYNLDKLGAIAPGYIADFLIVDDLRNFKVQKIFKNGLEINSEWTKEYKHISVDKVKGAVNIKGYSKEKLIIKSNKLVNAIELIPQSIVTKKIEIDLEKETDVAYIYVLERHNFTGNIGKGYIKGFGIKNGAIASTVSHDSHNLVVIGDNLDDIDIAIKKIKEMGGGLTLVSNKKILGELPLDIAGIMSSKSLEEISKVQGELTQSAYEKLNISKEYSPFMTLAFMALTVVPNLKITDRGLFDVEKFNYIDLNV